MSRQAGVSPLLKPLLASSDSIDPSDEVVGHSHNIGVAEDAGRGPCDNAVFHGPDFTHHGCNVGKVLPSLDDPPGDGGTHDVNDQMLAEEYRRGLRVCGGHRIVSHDLGFMFGEGDDVVEPSVDAS